RGMNLRSSLMEQGALEVTDHPGVVRQVLEEKIWKKFAPTEEQAFKSEAPVQQKMAQGGTGTVPPTTKRIFISCSEKNERQLQEVQTQLGFMEYPAELAISSSLEIPATENWQATIRKNLENANIIALLVSRDYLNDEWLLEEEIYPAVKLHEMGKAIVVPVILENCDWKKSPFGHLNPLPPGGQPIVAFKSMEGAWMSVVNGIRSLLDDENNPSGASSFRVT
ncbi:MAG: toll/interleukin-1 receptor domain-containing protein, partial [Saprospiraceae bacterium]